MTTYSFADLDKKLEKQIAAGEASTCKPIDRERIIIPTDCEQVVGFTNPDDLDVSLLNRWKAGERGPEFENQKLKPGDALIMYNNGRNINQLLEQYPGWETSPEGIKMMIEKLYSCAEVGGKMTEPAIWNSDFAWADTVKFTTISGQRVTKEFWKENSGKAVEGRKETQEQYFLHLLPGDKIKSPPIDENTEGIEYTAGAMSAIAVKQPDGSWNIVQLNAKGYEVVQEHISTRGRFGEHLRKVRDEMKDLRGQIKDDINQVKHNIREKGGIAGLFARKKGGNGQDL